MHFSPLTSMLILILVLILILLCLILIMLILVLHDYERAHLIMKASLHTKRQLEIDRDRGAAVGSLAQQYRLQL